MKKLANWWNKPITWGAYTKLCGIVWILSVIYVVIMYWYAFGVNVFDFVKKPFTKFKKKPIHESNEW